MNKDEVINSFSSSSCFCGKPKIAPHLLCEDCWDNYHNTREWRRLTIACERYKKAIEEIKNIVVM